MQRIEELEIPQKALRELIYNAIVHKLYSGPAILLRVFDKSVELWNYGLLPEELTPADLMKKHASYPRNRNIATVFYKAGFIESWGRDYKKIREEFEKAGHPVPTVEESGGGVLVTIQRKTIEEIIASRDKSGAVNGTANNENGGVNSDVTILLELTARQKRIKELISFRVHNGKYPEIDYVEPLNISCPRKLSILLLKPSTLKCGEFYIVGMLLCFLA